MPDCALTASFAGCANDKLVGQNTADNVIVQTLKENADSKHIVHIIKNKGYDQRGRKDNSDHSHDCKCIY